MESALYDNGAMPVTDEEIQHVRRLLDETRKRRDELEIQATRYGPYRVPAEISIELRETQESMERLDAKLRIVSVPLAVQTATGPESSIDVLRLSVHDMKDQIGTMWRYLEHMILEDRAVTDEWRKAQTKERKIGVWERRAVEIVLTVAVIVSIYLALNY
jgi:hypothetical protein